jgi:hypothetical protein
MAVVGVGVGYVTPVSLLGSTSHSMRQRGWLEQGNVMFPSSSSHTMAEDVWR